MTTRAKVTFPIWGCLTLLGVLFGGVGLILLAFGGLICGEKKDETTESVPRGPENWPETVH